MNIPTAKAVEKGDFADAKFYQIEGHADKFYRRLKKKSEGSVVALYDENTLRTQHFLQVWPPVEAQA